MQALTTWWDSRWARRLDYVAAIAALLILLRVGSEEDLSWLLWSFVGLAIAALSVIRWPFGAVITLVGVSVLPRFYLDVFGWKLRPEHAGALILAAIAAVWLIWKRPKITWDKLDYWVLAYLAINYISSAFASPEPSSTLKWAFLNNLGVLPYFLIRVLVQDVETLRKVFRVFIGVAILEAAYGIICYLSHVAFGTTFGMELGQYLVDVAAPYGSLYEPNLFGAYSACCAVMMLSLYFLESRGRLFYMLSFLMASLAAFVSFSRASLLALVLVVIFVFWKGRQRQSHGRHSLLVFAVAFGLVAVVAITAIGGVVQERLSNSFSQGLMEETTLTRLVILAESLQNIANHPLLGSGTASFQLFFDWATLIPEWAGTATWIGNFLVRVLHDTGIVGLAALLGFVVSLIVKTRQGLRLANETQPALFALSAGALVYFICFQFTDGTTLAFCWVHLGFLASAAVISGQDLNNSGESLNPLSGGSIPLTSQSPDSL
jgi:oligosaccharide repeat unit polymerase